MEVKTTLFKTDIQAEEPKTSADLRVNPRTVRNRLHKASRHHRKLCRVSSSRADLACARQLPRSKEWGSSGVVRRPP